MNLVRYMEMRYQVDELYIVVEVSLCCCHMIASTTIDLFKVVCENIRGGNMKELLLNADTGPITGQVGTSLTPIHY